MLALLLPLSGDNVNQSAASLIVQSISDEISKVVVPDPEPTSRLFGETERYC